MLHDTCMVRIGLESEQKLLGILFTRAGGDASIFLLDQLCALSSPCSPMEQHTKERLTTDSDTFTAACSTAEESMDALHCESHKRAIDDGKEQEDCVQTKRSRDEAGMHVFFV